MKRALPVLAAALLGAPLVASAQTVVVTYPAPAPQPGGAYYCSNPTGWYPAVRNCAAEWVTYRQQPAQPSVVHVVPGTAYPAPTPQSGMAYYCSAPEGWYPAVSTCSAAWVAYAQQPAVTYVVPGTPGALLVERSPARTGPDAASDSAQNHVNP